MSPQRPTPTSILVHSQLFGGASVTSAGNTLLHDGKLCYINNQRGHYQPSREKFLKFMENSLAGFDPGTIYSRTGITFVAPDPHEECRALVAARVGLVVEPPTLELAAPLNGTATGTVTLTSFVSTQYRIVNQENWLLFAPTEGVLTDGVPVNLTVTAQCGGKPDVLTGPYKIRGPDGSDLTGGKTTTRVILDCHR